MYKGIPDRWRPAAWWTIINDIQLPPSKRKEPKLGLEALGRRYRVRFSSIFFILHDTLCSYMKLLLAGVDGSTFDVRHPDRLGCSKDDQWTCHVPYTLWTRVNFTSLLNQVTVV